MKGARTSKPETYLNHGNQSFGSAALRPAVNVNETCREWGYTSLQSRPHVWPWVPTRPPEMRPGASILKGTTIC